jgi:anaerobic selenocysteine-containing dehydrogenase
MNDQLRILPDKIVRGACPLDCPDTCSWEVTVKDGRAIDLRGAKDHPYTRGSLCVKLNKYLDHVSAPDRLLYPMRRIGRKGEGRFERITWAEAFAEIADRLQSIIAQHGGEAIWPYVGTGSLGFLQGEAGVGQRLWNALGTSIHSANICSRAGSVGTMYTMGSRHGMDPEGCRQSKLIILWGTNPLTSHNHVWRFIAEARANGAYVVVIDPIRTRTAEQADEYISIIPGTDAALALGLLNIVVTSGAEDRAYLEQHTLGWDQYRARIME